MHIPDPSSLTSFFPGVYALRREVLEEAVPGNSGVGLRAIYAHP